MRTTSSHRDNRDMRETVSAFPWTGTPEERSALAAAFSPQATALRYHEVIFTLPLATSTNRLTRDILITGVNKRGQASTYTRRVKTREYRDFKAGAIDTLRKCYRLDLDPEWSQARFIGYEALAYTATWARDLSNCLKGFEDALAEALGFNDNRVIEVNLRKRVGQGRPRMTMRLYLLNEPTWKGEREK